MRYSDEEALLGVIAGHPTETQTRWAEILGWRDGFKRPYRVKVQRSIQKLRSIGALRKDQDGNYIPTRDPIPYSAPPPNTMAQVYLPEREVVIMQKARGIQDIASDLNRLAYELRQIIGLHEQREAGKSPPIDSPIDANSA